MSRLSSKCKEVAQSCREILVALGQTTLPAAWSGLALRERTWPSLEFKGSQRIWPKLRGSWTNQAKRIVQHNAKGESLSWEKSFWNMLQHLTNWPNCNSVLDYDGLWQPQIYWVASHPINQPPSLVSPYVWSVKNPIRALSMMVKSSPWNMTLPQWMELHPGERCCGWSSSARSARCQNDG